MTHSTFIDPFTNLFSGNEIGRHFLTCLDEFDGWNLLHTSKEFYKHALYFRKLLEERCIVIAQSLVGSESLSLTKRQLDWLNSAQKNAARLKMTPAERENSSFNVVLFVCSLTPDQKKIVFNTARLSNLSFHPTLMRVASDKSFVRKSPEQIFAEFTLTQIPPIGNKEQIEVSDFQIIESVRSALAIEEKEKKINLLFAFLSRFEELRFDFQLAKMTIDKDAYSFVLDVILVFLAKKHFEKGHKENLLSYCMEF